MIRKRWLSAAVAAGVLVATQPPALGADPAPKPAPSKSAPADSEGQPAGKTREPKIKPCTPEQRTADGGACAKRDKKIEKQKEAKQNEAAKLTAAIRELATLLGAGIGLVEALDVLVKQHRGSFQSSLVLLRDDVAGGSGLAEAMRTLIKNHLEF